ncbi:DUF6153 family protein [Dactylosporangium salmoneum]|uniref:DUF6153 family protein n=1 Tax=Dactylosporangium salmoneum TaxID=53361 RepID=UPI0031D4AA0F
MAHAVNGGLGRAARIALLLATLVGLTAMHTLGHSGPHLGDGHRHAPVAEHVAAMPVLSAVLLTGSGHEHGGMDDWAICLAVLVAFAVVVLGVALLARRSTTTAAALRHAARQARPRAPPPRPVGLALATVSVLRR